MTTETRPKGLDDDQVARSRAEHGSNVLPTSTSRSMWEILRANVFTLFNGIVLACFTLLAVLGRWQDAIFGFSAVANSIIGVWQEYSAKRQLDNLRVLSAPHAKAYRSGGLVDLHRDELVVGDLIALRAGDQIPADARVETATGLQVDESLLTGEEDAVDKPEGAALLSGAIVVAGSATATLERVGGESFAAKLTAEAKRFSLVNSEIRNGLNRVLRLVAWLLLPVLLIVVNGQIQAFGGWEAAIETGAWREAAVGAVAAAIALVPLGLLLMTSVAFAAGALKLGRKKVLVQELHAVEGLARVDVLCFDKTGTLTEGGVAYGDTHPGPDPAPGWRHALASFAADEGANETARSLVEEYGAGLARPVATAIPFDSQRKWSALSLEGAEAPGTWILGAPDIVLQPDRDAELLEEVERLSSAGLRVVALCHDAEGLTTAASRAAALPAERRGVLVLSLRERIRADAAETIRYFHEEGVSLRVISGDDPRTVTAVAREAGLIGADETGIDSRTLPDDPELLGEVMEDNHVFGRVTPVQKRQMVQALQAKGHVVAMTGDGVNDVLALKESDLGIAMGNGSGASRAVSRLTLLDNQFEALPSVVLEGRQAIANVERLSMLYLAKTAWAFLIAIIFGLMLVRYPFEPRQLSLLDGISIGWPAFVLALLPNSRRYIAGYFRRALSFALPAGAVITAGVLAVAWFGDRYGQTVAQQQTAASIVMAVLSLWVLGLVCRPFRPLLAAVLLGCIGVLLLAMFTPLTVWFFGFAWPDAPVLFAAGGICAVGCALLELHGRWRARSAERELAGR
ncbi:HAD-IC family P-type ATPase [Gulosibacter sp. 10]|uniref:HAD-IC family P-type ATPase n=1 Tax=Gulosibacter sp. 10 TaxID=1255570 RepID=UPI00097F5F6C|nr:HAD-IC family P-type ATPase [Gulosibacter sp. 10]SJM70380.1 Cation-transporting ATPase, E1-E2 family [Gulosibacter sp. 10]